jgi:hypothetical protein
MSLWGQIADLVRRDAKKLMYVPIPSSHTDVKSDETVIQAGKHYFRLWLSEMHLKRDRDWFKSWYPVTHTLVRFQFGEQQVEIPNVAGPLKLNGVNAGNLENVVKLNYAMTTLMPFRGGTVEIMAGLLAMKGKDYLQAFLGVMESFAELLVVPQLSAALKVAGPVANGVEKLIGATDGELHLGLHQTLQSQPGGSNLLRPGYIAVIRAEENEVDATKLWIVEDRLRFGNDLAGSQPFKQFPHIVFRIEKQTERDDWDALTSIAEPRAEMVKALAKGDKDSAKGYKVTAQTAVLLSPDLTVDHKKLVFHQLQKEFDDFPVFEPLDAENELTPQLSLSWAMKNPVVEGDLELLQLPTVGELFQA